MSVINKTVLLVAVFFTALLMISCGPDEAPLTIDQVGPPEWAYNSTIYEVNVRQFSEEGTFAKVEEALPRLQELGVEILWLMPIHPIGEKERKGTMGSYYSVRDYFDVNPEFGSKDDFRSLVEATHEHGMKLILDWVANHTAWDNYLTETNPDFYVHDEDGNFIIPPGTDWDDVIQLDYDNPEVHNYMISALRYWVEEFNIDGYRADVAYLVPTEFWERARLELESIKNVFMLAEAEEPGLHPAFDMSYMWGGHHTMNGIASGENTLADLDEYMDRIRNEFPETAFMMAFTSNHDENSWAETEFNRLGDGVEAFGVLIFTKEAMPLLYNGQETGFNRMLEFFEKDPIDWDYDSPFQDFYATLIDLKRTNTALRNGHKGAPMERLESSNDEAIYAFVRQNDEDRVVVVLNLSDDAQDVTISYGIEAGTYTDLFSGDEVTISESTDISFGTMDAWGYTVLVK